MQVPQSARIRAMFDAHYDVVWRSLRRFGVRAPDADDAAQEVFIVAVKRLEDIKTGSERSFLIGTAIRVASETRRKDVKRPIATTNELLAELQDPALNPHDLAEERERRVMLDEALAALGEDLRAVFVLFELEQMTMAAIAEALELAPGTVASRLRRAREAFREAALVLEKQQRRNRSS